MLGLEFILLTAIASPSLLFPPELMSCQRVAKGICLSARARENNVKIPAFHVKGFQVFRESLYRSHISGILNNTPWEPYKRGYGMHCVIQGECSVGASIEDVIKVP